MREEMAGRMGAGSKRQANFELLRIVAMLIGAFGLMFSINAPLAAAAFTRDNGSKLVRVADLHIGDEIGDAVGLVAVDEHLTCIIRIAVIVRRGNAGRLPILSKRYSRRGYTKHEQTCGENRMKFHT